MPPSQTVAEVISVAQRESLQLLECSREVGKWGEFAQNNPLLAYLRARCQVRGVVMAEMQLVAKASEMTPTRIAFINPTLNLARLAKDHPGFALVEQYCIPIFVMSEGRVVLDLSRAFASYGDHPDLLDLKRMEPQMTELIEDMLADCGMIYDGFLDTYCAMDSKGSFVRTKLRIKDYTGAFEAVARDLRK